MPVPKGTGIARGATLLGLIRKTSGGPEAEKQNTAVRATSQAVLASLTLSRYGISAEDIRYPHPITEVNRPQLLPPKGVRPATPGPIQRLRWHRAPT